MTQILTDSHYCHANGHSYDQQQIAAIGMLLTDRYTRWDDKAGEEWLYAHVAQEVGVERSFVKSVAHWVGLFIDGQHDTDPAMGAYSKAKERTWDDWMNFAYDMIEDR